MAKILLVEDDTNLSEIYQARMEAEGYTVVGAPDGESALALAAKEKPDLIISDVMMPKISGFEMLDILRNTDGLKHTRVIMLTALGQAEDRIRAESLGADKYLVKSQVTLEDIVSAAQELLGDGEQMLPTPAQLAAPVVTAAPVVAAPVQAAPTGPLQATTPAAYVPEPPAAAPVPVAAPLPAPVVAPAAPAPMPVVASPVAAPAAELAATPASLYTPQTVAPPAAPVAVPLAVPPAPATPPAADEVTPAPQLVSSPPDANQYYASPLPEIAAPQPTPALQPSAFQPAEPSQVVPAAPSSATPIAAANIDDNVVANAIDKLLATSEAQNQAAIAPGTADDRPHKKVIEPIDHPPAPTLQELLALEAAKDSVGLGGTSAADSQPPVKRDPFDPNSISL